MKNRKEIINKDQNMTQVLIKSNPRQEVQFMMDEREIIKFMIKNIKKKIEKLYQVVI